MIQITDVTVRFGGVVALDAVSADFTAAVSGVIGPNGAGKTTLMNVVSGFVTAKSGQVQIDQTNILTLSPHRRANWGLRRSFQKEEIANDLTVFENVLVQCDHSDNRNSDKTQDVMRMLDSVGMTDQAHRLGLKLNSFERRLTDIARCMVGNPKLVLLDEPAGGLSISETQILGELITRIPSKTGAQVLVIDHDVDLISRICSETLVLDFGKRIAFGPTKSVLSDPAVKGAYLGAEELE